MDKIPGEIPFSRQAIYQIRSDTTSKQWKRDPDPLKSAQILINEASQPNAKHPSYQIESIPLHDEPGFTGIAFALPHILRKWGGRIREISLDSTCQYALQMSGRRLTK